MDIDLLKEEISAANRVIKEKSAYIAKAKQEIAEHHCPFDVGDRVINHQGVEEVVACIVFATFRPHYDFKTYKIKKDGTPCKQSQYAYNCHRYTKAV